MFTGLKMYEKLYETAFEPPFSERRVPLVLENVIA